MTESLSARQDRLETIKRNISRKYLGKLTGLHAVSIRNNAIALYVSEELDPLTVQEIKQQSDGFEVWVLPDSPALADCEASYS